MREIKYRGICIETDEWFYGDLLKNEHETYIVDDFESSNDYGDGYDVYATNFKKVHQKTVGEHTGVVDKNGKDIYEGDIVRITSNIRDDYNALITFFNGGFCAIDGTEGNHSLRIYRLSNSELEIEVIGNIHENPNLLEGENNV